MDSKVIIEVISKLVGEISAVGDSVIDKEINDNLKNLIDVMGYYLYELIACADNKNSYEASVKKNGELAYSALVEFKKFIETVIE